MSLCRRWDHWWPKGSRVLTSQAKDGPLPKGGGNPSLQMHVVVPTVGSVVVRHCAPTGLQDEPLGPEQGGRGGGGSDIVAVPSQPKHSILRAWSSPSFCCASIPESPAPPQPPATDSQTSPPQASSAGQSASEVQGAPEPASGTPRANTAASAAAGPAANKIFHPARPLLWFNRPMLCSREWGPE